MFRAIPDTSLFKYQIILFLVCPDLDPGYLSIEVPGITRIILQHYPQGGRRALLILLKRSLGQTRHDQRLILSIQYQGQKLICLTFSAVHS